MGMGLKRYGAGRARNQRIRRRRMGNKRRRRGGKGLGSLLFMCCMGAKKSQAERNREEICQLFKTQQVIVLSHNMQGMSNTSTNVGQPSGFQTANAFGTQPSQFGTPNPSGSTTVVVPAPSSGFGMPNTVAPCIDAAAVQVHQTNQLQLLNEIQARQSVETDPEKRNVLNSQFNELVEQMRVMESIGYTYQCEIPPTIQLVGNPHNPVMSSAVPMT